MKTNLIKIDRIKSDCIKNYHLKTNLLKIDRIKNITLAVAGRSEPNTFTAPGEKESFIPPGLTTKMIPHYYLLYNIYINLCIERHILNLYYVPLVCNL